jgi:hypothetical protein
LLVTKAGVLAINRILIFTILSAEMSKVPKESIVLLKSKLAAIRRDSGNWSLFVEIIIIDHI